MCKSTGEKDVCQKKMSFVIDFCFVMKQISINNVLNGDSWKIMFALRSISNIGQSLFAFIIIDSDCWIKFNTKIRSVFYELEKIMDIYTMETK